MSKNEKSKRKPEERAKVKADMPDQAILDSIGGPNAWTPEAEDRWLQELKKLPPGEIYRRFPPMKKPPNVRSRGKSIGWGDQSA